MTLQSTALLMLASEARALLTRLDRVESFTLHTPMVPAAALPLSAQIAIERHLAAGRGKLRGMVTSYIRWLEGGEGKRALPADAQRRFTFIRLRFNAILAQLDIFAEVLNQRSEHDTGVWLSGLDAFAADALNMREPFYEAPPVICYLDRGPGAAIRRARTRLPGGESNPVAVIRVPRERMIGSGIAASLVHEVGHQGAALLDLVGSLKTQLRGKIMEAGAERIAWTCWDRWISEIVADFWSVARLGAAATVGLMSVVSLPRVFVFRVNLDDPHPAPWIRVKLSCAMGRALYPHPQWEVLASLWEAYYPPRGLGDEARALFSLLEKTMPELSALLLGHRSKTLRGKRLGEAIASFERMPASLAGLYRVWRDSPSLMRRVSPTLVFAVLGQAKIDGMIIPEEESRILSELLKYWALRITLDTSEICASTSKKAPERTAPLLTSGSATA